MTVNLKEECSNVNNWEKEFLKFFYCRALTNGAQCKEEHTSMEEIRILPAAI